MKTKGDIEMRSESVSRREMLGKTAKYAALIPTASLIVTKANAHTFTGLSADCPGEFNGANPDNHCFGSNDQNHTFIDPV